MYKAQLECTYCGYTWEKTYNFKISEESEECLKCKDKNIIFRYYNKNEGPIDYYKGSPPFPEKKKEEKEPWPYWGLMEYYNKGDYLSHIFVDTNWISDYENKFIVWSKV